MNIIIISHTILELLVKIEFYFDILLELIVYQLYVAGKFHSKNILYKIRNSCSFKTKNTNTLNFFVFLKT